MPSPRLLTEIDELLRPDHPHLRRGDRCFFLREYLPREGFAGGETNSLILNLKKSPERRGLPEWRYKERAIAHVASELRAALGPTWLTQGTLLVPIPPSKAPDDPRFDDRMEQVAGLVAGGTEAQMAPALRLRTSMEALHRRDDRRDIRELRARMEVIPGALDPVAIARIILLDDVLTTGAHFRAAQETLAEAVPARPIVGVFVARRVPASA